MTQTTAWIGILGAIVLLTPSCTGGPGFEMCREKETASVVDGSLAKGDLDGPLLIGDATRNAADGPKPPRPDGQNGGRDASGDRIAHDEDASAPRPDGANRDAPHDRIGPNADGDRSDAPHDRTAPRTDTASAPECGFDSLDACEGDGPAPSPACGNGQLDEGELCDDGNRDAFDLCSNECEPAADHLLLTEVAVRPGSAEFVEIHNPTRAAVDLSSYALGDTHLYYAASGDAAVPLGGTDFVAMFPSASLAPGAYATVALSGATGAGPTFESTYGRKPDFELCATADGGPDDESVPNMVPLPNRAAIGGAASFTDTGEPVILFRVQPGQRMLDVDYVFFGSVSNTNPAVDKTGVLAEGGRYAPDRPATAQRPAAAPGNGQSLHRCRYSEPGETRGEGNGTSGHDETSEDGKAAFTPGSAPFAPTPGGPPPPGLCDGTPRE